jgi:predicted SAM-dependent methyltransferase
MNRLINLYTIKKQEHIEGFDNIEISDLPNIVNHSVDHIYCGCLENFDTTTAISTAEEISKKIRPDGLITLTINNLKHISRQYFNSALADADLLNLISGVKSIFSIKQIETIFEEPKSFRIVKIEHSSNFFKTHITMKRIGI